MTIPSSRSLIFEVKSTGSELAFIRVVRLRKTSDVFGRLRISSGIFGNDRVVFKNPSTPRIKISRLYLRKSWQVKENRFRSTDLTCWQSTNHCVLIRFLTALNTSSWEAFWSKGDSSHFKNSPSFQISWTYSDVFQINEKFIHNCPPCLLAEMANVASSVARPRKCYVNRPERFIKPYKEPLDQSDCWKLFV